MRTIKQNLLIAVLLIHSIISIAQTLQPADSTISEIILRKHLKAMFLDGCLSIKGKENPDSVLQNSSRGRDYGDYFIRLTAYAYGDWALKPDFRVYKTDIKSLWENYEIYKLEIPKYSPRNDSIAGYYGYRDRCFGVDNPSNPLSYENLIAYNKITGMMFYLDWPFNVFFHKSKSLLFNNRYPKLSWSTLPDLSVRKLPLLSPKSKEERKKLLVSELMKNIYSYRLIKSGILDSLREMQNQLKENVEQFPLIDSLLPEYDENLYMKGEVIKSFPNEIEYWRFEYPGYDSLCSAKGGRRSRAWEKYMPLKRQYYVVGFELKRELVHFISGKDFYKTPFANCYFPYSQRFMLNQDSSSFAAKREWYVKDRMSSLCPDLYFYLRNEWGYESNGEDENYWYFIVHSVIPYNKMIPYYDDDGNKISDMCCLPPYYKFCDYKVRMSKKNWEIVEIVDTIKCFNE